MALDGPLTQIYQIIPQNLETYLHWNAISLSRSQVGLPRPDQRFVKERSHKLASLHWSLLQIIDAAHSCEQPSIPLNRHGPQVGVHPRNQDPNPAATSTFASSDKA